MDLNQLNFTRRRFRSDAILYNDYLLEFSAGKNIIAGQYELSKLSGDTVTINPRDNNIDFSQIPISIEVSFVPFEYPNPGNKSLIAYGPNINNASVPCFTSILKNSIRLLGQSINNGGPGSRLGMTLQRSRYNIWAFGGYPGAGGTGSTADSYFFLFNGTSNNWVDKTDLAIKENIPNLVYHTMTNINDEYLIIIGGGTYNNQGILVDKPFDKVYKFDLNTESWSTASLVNCPTNTKIGHTTTIVNGNFIVIGGTDNQQESKLNIYSDILSIDPTTLKCTNINIKYDNGVSTSIKRAFHITNYIENYLIINSGMRETDYDNQEILIDTSTWTRNFKFKNIEFKPTLDSNTPSNKPTSNTETIIYSVVGVVLFIILASFLYYFFIFRKGKKRDLNNIQTLTSQINNQKLDVEWVKSDSNIVQLDNEAVFTLDDKVAARINTEADREADLDQLNSLNLTYKNNDSFMQNSISNSIQGFSGTFTNSKFVNNENLGDDDNTLASVHLLKD